MRVAQFIPQRTQTFNHRLASTQNLFEDLFGMLAWAQAQLFRGQTI
jgi:hypothetical protein